MINLSLGFEKFEYFLMFLLLTLVFSFWIYLKLKKSSYFSLTPFILINVLLLATWGWLTGIGHDTPEHFHCAWMVSQGLIPYKDFWQHHPPLLWLILAPLFKILKPTVLIFDAARIFCALIFAAIGFIGWQIAKEVWREKAKLSTYLLVLSSASILGQFLWFRPDLFMDIFLLLGIYFSLGIPGNKRVTPVFLAGLSFALGASFNLKQYFLYFLPIIIIFWEKDKFRIVKFLVYIFGLVAGVAPTLFYLIKKGILTDFIFWVLMFNSYELTWSVYFPIAIGFMGIWGAYLLLVRCRNFKDSKALVLFIAFCLSSLGSLSRHTFFFPFYIGFWFILCAIAGSGCNIIGIFGKIPSLIKKSIIAGLFFNLLIFPNILIAQRHEETSFSEHKKVISKLMEYCQGETCLVLLPLHPIFNYDATRLYSHWQYLLSNHILDLRVDINNKNIAQAIINSRPAVIEYKHIAEDQIFIIDLLLKNLVSPQDLRKIRTFLKENYTVKEIGKSKYYIRNDKLNDR